MDDHKIPRHLMEQWSAVDDEGVHLATIRVYPNAASASGKKPRIMLVLPPRPEDPSGAGEQFEMDMVNDDVENQIVVAEREKEPNSGSRARTTILTGRIKHECNLRPLLTDGYMRRVKQRSQMANQPRRQAKIMDDTISRGSLNRLTSGAASQSPFQLTVRTAFFTCALTVDTELGLFGCRGGSRSPQRASSSAWHVCRAISSSTSSSACSTTSASGGRSRPCGSAHSSPRRTSRRSSARSRFSIGLVSSTARGNSWRTSRRRG